MEVEIFLFWLPNDLSASAADIIGNVKKILKEINTLGNRWTRFLVMISCSRFFGERGILKLVYFFYKNYFFNEIR